MLNSVGLSVTGVDDVVGFSNPVGPTTASEREIHQSYRFSVRCQHNSQATAIKKIYANTLSAVVKCVIKIIH